MKRIVIFIDDLRIPSLYVDCKKNNVFQAFNYDEFVGIIDYLYERYGHIDEVWFDHDLGEDSKNGYDCAKYLIEFCENHNMELPEWHIQSSNPSGRENIDSYLKSYLKSLTL